ncbi:putative bifunctional diguanylate cyclase/phosphodiesterase [Extensimonas sp. H3M7-6]|uniref:putative bifunctional diguanylate cyclase/phosphodiesterase n=1 Tax=Extensimonas soli TaxID=3031322 RepID=UPI0023DA4F62|nr:EAL domain-containing protein [Extensimonas sp. H3M7-6]MDF1483028.1 EAL domain-containing protein [Extensimonas sp. H3M7-6]
MPIFLSETITRLRESLRVVWPFLLLALLQAVLAGASIYALSAVRALTGGEVLWVLGQKDALYYLDRFAEYGREDDFRAYQNNLAIPLAERDARLSLESPVPSYEVMRRGFIDAGNHPDDLDSVIWLLSTFWNFELVREPVRQWAIGEKYLDQVQALAKEVRAARQANSQVDTAMVQQWRGRIDTLHRLMLPGILAFNRSLGESARRIVVILLVFNGLTAMAVVGLALLRVGILLQRQRKMENDMAIERQGAQLTLGAIADGVIALDTQGLPLYMNPAAKRMLGIRFRKVHQRGLAEWLRFDASVHPAEEVARLLDHVQQGELAPEDKHSWHLLRSDAKKRIVQLTVARLQIHGRPSGVGLVLRDVTRENDYLDQITWQASHDDLTGLANRREFERRLEALLISSGQAQPAGAVLYVDLDQFKVINDTCGHQAGDAMLRKISGELQANLRADDVLARLGGDEFGILLPGCPPLVALRLAEQMRLAVQACKLQWDVQELATTLSVGLVELTPELDSMQEVLRVADVACYRAKERGRNMVYLYQPDDAEVLQRVGHMHWVQRLRKALEQDRFSLYAQTIAPLHSEPPGLHFEVLLRLHDEDGKLVPPGSFIPAAETYGLMPEIDRWVVQHVFARLAQQARQAKMLPVHTCSINLSGASLGGEDLLDFLLDQFSHFGVDPRQVCFEITETSAIAHLPTAVRLIKRLRQLGCRFSLDDFGSGMSSFGYLKQLEVDFLKIDGSFVRDMVKDRASAAMVDSINRIGHVLGQRTIAEFVVTPAHVQALRALGVDYAQGYAVAKPRPIEEVLAGEKAAALTGA